MLAMLCISASSRSPLISVAVEGRWAGRGSMFVLAGAAQTQVAFEGMQASRRRACMWVQRSRSFREPSTSILLRAECDDAGALRCAGMLECWNARTLSSAHIHTGSLIWAEE